MFDYSLHGQSIISGVIKDYAGQPIAFANVFVKSVENANILAFTHTNIEGKYTLPITETGDFSINFTSITFKSAFIIIEIEKDKNYIQNIILENEITKLDEVIVQLDKPITIKKDTIIYNVKNFRKGNETVVEDLLRNLPGINVASNGTIKIGNQEVEKVMIEGDDFFEHGYKILTKNLNAEVIDKVAIYKKYSSNRLLKGIENSNKVVLNLTLKKDLKTQWFGNTSLGYGLVSENQYDLRTNLMSFGKKAKYYGIGNLNNVGTDAIGDVNDLIRPFQLGDENVVGENENAISLLNLNSSKPNLNDKRTNFNNAELVSLNAIFTLSSKVKIKTLGFFNWDENDFYRKGFETFMISNATFTNTDDYKLRKKKITGFGKIDLNYDISKFEMLEYSGKYNNGQEKTITDLLFNTNKTNEKLEENNLLIDQKVIYTNRFEKNKAFILFGRYINEQTPQNYTNNQFLFPDLLPISVTATDVVQTSKNQMQFLALEAHVFDKKKQGNLFEAKAGFQSRRDILNSELSFNANGTTSIAPSNYLNDITYKTNCIYGNIKYSYLYRTITIEGKLALQQLFNTIYTNQINENQQPFLANTSLLFLWQISKNNKVSTSYSYNTTNAKITDVYSNYVLTSYRTFEKGTNKFDQLQANTFFINYTLGNWGEKFFANASVYYYKNHDFYSTNTVVQPTYSQSEKIIIKDRNQLNVNTDINYFIKTISSNLKLDIGFSKSNYKNIVNSDDLREVLSENYNYEIELRSSFKGFLNYHLGSKWTVTKIETSIVNKNTSNITFLDLFFIFNKNFNADLQSERYYFGNLDKANNKYYFLDLNAKYTLKNNKLSFTLSGKNLLDTKTFKQSYISDIAISTIEYRLLPRSIILKMDFRF